MQTEKACSVAYNIELFKQTLKVVCPQFEVNEQNKKLLNEIYLYCNNIKGELDTQKGLWLWGSIGTGKSTLLSIVAHYTRLLYPKPNYTIYHRPQPYCGGFKLVNCTKAANDFARNAREGSQGIEPYINPIEMGFDELGREPIPVRSFGTEMNVMQYIFQSRYETRHTARTHVTTNMPIDSIAKLYGEYIADRVCEMFNIIDLSGRTWRR